MEKVTNIVCLVLWVIALVTGIVCAAIDEPINPVSYVCAVLVCVMHYGEELIRG